MTDLKSYMDDGANHQARAVLAFMQCSYYADIEESWDDKSKRYLAEIKVSRWDNGREQGYVIMLRHLDKQLNIAWFEHRNSDNICAVKWEEFTINAPTIDSAKLGKVYKDKYSTSYDVTYSEIKKMADWIHGQLTLWWLCQTDNKGDSV